MKKLQIEYLKRKYKEEQAKNREMFEAVNQVKRASEALLASVITSCVTPKDGVYEVTFPVPKVISAYDCDISRKDGTYTIRLKETENVPNC